MAGRPEVDPASALRKMLFRDIWRALAVSALVGSVMSWIHCRDLILREGPRALCDWHVYSSYLVPLLVSLVSVRLARRR